MQINKKLFGKSILTAIFAFVISAANISAATFTVTNTNDSGAGSLRQAITDANAATTADTIVFDASFNTARTITLASTLTITGSATNTLTITGTGANLLTVSGNNAVRIFQINSGAVASLSGMTITQGRGDFGIAFRTAAASLTLTGLVITGNAADNGGAGIYHTGETINISGCVISNNITTSSGGGGVYFDSISTAATISNSTISGNQATGTFARGGGIYQARAGQVTISNSTITGNSANYEGGGIYYSGNSPTTFLNITDSTISNNTANLAATDVNYGYGGGLLLNSTLGTGTTITNSTISGNRALRTGTSGGGQGGGIWANSNLVSLVNTTLSGNTAGTDGGGIFDAAGGGGTDVFNITGATIVNNTAGVNFGGVTAQFGNGPHNLRNTIVANNTALGGTSPDLGGFGTFTSGGYNLFRNTSGATIAGNTSGNITGVDPRIDGVLRNNGGATKTHALRRTSPALNAADAANVAATDQRGLPRPGAGSTLPDIGAYERQSNDLVVPAAFDFEDDGRADLSVFRPAADPAVADFYIRRSSDNAFQGVSWGLPGDRLSPADYDGDGKTDVAIWRDEPANPDRAYFYILQSQTNTVRAAQFGKTGDDPSFVGDWDGDGTADPAVYRPSNNTFYYRPSAAAGTDFVGITWGASGDIPMRGDFDGDIKLDAAVFRPSNNTWYIRQSSDGTLRVENWGISSDKFVPADYDADGKTDLAVFRNGTWYIRQSSSNTARYETFGLASDRLVPTDYDGDGKADLAVFRDGSWYLNQSLSGFAAQTFGANGDQPIPGRF